MKKHQSGFTLVEIAIVLVIIGLLLGGVLKGQAMIENAKIRNVTSDIEGVQAAFYAYQDRFKALPGDDKNALTHFTGVINGDGNGTIGGNYNDVAGTPATETQYFWQHLRSAGFMKGLGTDGIPPNATTGGKIGVQNSPLGLTGPAVCVSIDSTYAQGIDANIDDGDATKGDVRASVAGALNAAVATGDVAVAYAAPVAANPYVTLCKKM